MRNFYERMLPAQGVYCATGISSRTGKVTNVFAESLDELFNHVIDMVQAQVNVFIAPATFKNHSRLADNAAYVRSFFVDLDCGEGKPYATQDDAIKALTDFCSKFELPPPVMVNSGGGIHGYWILDRDVPAAEWRPYAKRFKQFCLDCGLHIDPVVTADAARIMRAAGTINYKHGLERETSLINTNVGIYSFDVFKEFLGETEPDVFEILASVEKGLDEDTRKILKTDNFETLFEDIAVKSLEGSGCAQIAHCLISSSSLSEPMWYAALSIARHCEDWETAIHTLSEDHPGYNRDATIRKAEQTLNKPQSCEQFENHNPGGCNGCPFRGQVTNPLPIGRKLRQPPEPPASTASTTPTSGSDPFKSSSANLTLSVVTPLPKSLSPYQRGVNGGIYYVPPPEKDKSGKVIQADPILIIRHDLYPVKRMYSPSDGECLLMRATLPHDAPREFLLPMKDLYLPDRFKEIVGKNGVLFRNEPQMVHLVMNYVNKWGNYLIDSNSAEQMRMQMGWTEGRDAFVIGNQEIRRDGRVLQAAASPFVRGIAKLLKPYGSFDIWQQSANMLNEPYFETYAFGLLTGFGSTLMHMTSTNGVTVCFTGESGCGKTGSLYGAISIWGHPVDLSVFDATDNGMIGRYLGLKNLPLGCDEVSNKRPDQLSNLIHRISHGKAKIRMQASVNAERELEMAASLINFMTSNQSIYDKLTDLKANPDGEVARVVEFAVTKPKPMQDHPELGKKIFNVFHENYGHAGPRFVEHCFKAGDDHIKRLINKWGNRFITDFGADTAYRFYENLVAATFAAGELAVEAGIVSYDLDRIFNSVVTQMLAIRNHTVQINFRDYEALVSQFIYAHQSDVLIMKNNQVTSEPRNKIMARSEIHTGMLFVAKSEFKKFLSELQISSREFENAMQKQGLLTFVGKMRLTAGWKAGMQLAALSCYGFKFDLPNDVIRAALKSADEPKQ